MKKTIAIIFAFLLFVSLVAPAYAANSHIVPYDINSGFGEFYIEPNGNTYIGYRYDGDNFTESVTVTVRLEKRLLLVLWTDVEEWTITSYDAVSSGELEYQLTKSGTYRCTIVYEVTNTDGTTETHEYQKEVEYDPA